jgi:hypothetical protein
MEVMLDSVMGISHNLFGKITGNVQIKLAMSMTKMVTLHVHISLMMMEVIYYMPNMNIIINKILLWKRKRYCI